MQRYVAFVQLRSTLRTTRLAALTCLPGKPMTPPLADATFDQRFPRARPFAANPASLSPRAPRLGFDEAARLA